eukprot:COSAG06_NODE_11484_length_1501_cov_3.267094_1_plen_172_part_00
MRATRPCCGAGLISLGLRTCRRSCSGKETSFLRRFILKMVSLPRQARDKHRESTQKESDAFSYSPDMHGEKKGSFCPLLYKNAIILPRQARDNHRETTQKETVFLQARRLCTSRRCRATRTWCAFMSCLVLSCLVLSCLRTWCAFIIDPVRHAFPSTFRPFLLRQTKALLR